MLTKFDRIQMVVADRAATAERWLELLDAEEVGEDVAAPFCAQRTTLAVGTSEVELLEPDGPGLAADFMRDRRGLGPVGVGFQTPDVQAVAARLRESAVEVEPDGDRFFVDCEALGLPGLRVTIGPETERPRVGLMQRLYESTYLVGDADESSARFAEAFGLDAGSFCPIESENFGYAGQLTLFDPDDLDRIEIIHPYDTAKTMGRFFERRGAGLYMCYGETDRSGEVRDRALEIAPDGITATSEGDTPDNLFLHHTALGSAMMGISRTSYAWTWSGRPDRVVP
jgi:hypothetical protein